jgi:hypothetical protein
MWFVSVLFRSVLYRHTAQRCIVFPFFFFFFFVFFSVFFFRAAPFILFFCSPPPAPLPATPAPALRFRLPMAILRRSRSFFASMVRTAKKLPKKNYSTPSRLPSRREKRIGQNTYLLSNILGL